MFESVRADSIARAVSQREFQLKSVEKMFEYQTYAADRICENSKVELMGNMLKELQERQELIQARLSGQEARPEARSQRTLRSKRGKAEEAAGVGADQKGAGAAAGVPEPGQAAAQAITVALKSEEALSDMKAIYRDWKAVGTAVNPTFDSDGRWPKSSCSSTHYRCHPPRAGRATVAPSQCDRTPPCAR